MRQSNRLVISIVALVILIAASAIIYTGNPDLFGTAGGQGRGNAFGLTRQAPDQSGGSGEASGSGEVVVDPTEDSGEIDEVEIELDAGEGQGEPPPTDRPGSSSSSGSSGGSGNSGSSEQQQQEQARQVPPTATSLPTSTPAPVIAPDGGSLVIQPGYTISELARYLTGLYGYPVTTEQIEQLNPNVNPRDMIPGTDLVIPTIVPTSAADIAATQQAIVTAIPPGETLIYYTIKPGDTISQIAAQVSQQLGRQVTTDEIERINALIVDPNTDLITPGEVIAVPALLSDVDSDDVADFVVAAVPPTPDLVVNVSLTCEFNADNTVLQAVRYQMTTSGSDPSISDITIQVFDPSSRAILTTPSILAAQSRGTVTASPGVYRVVVTAAGNQLAEATVNCQPIIPTATPIIDLVVNASLTCVFNADNTELQSVRYDITTTGKDWTLTSLDIQLFDPSNAVIDTRSLDNMDFSNTSPTMTAGTYRIVVTGAGNQLAAATVDCQPIIPTATPIPNLMVNVSLTCQFNDDNTALVSVRYDITTTGSDPSIRSLKPQLFDPSGRIIETRDNIDVANNTSGQDTSIPGTYRAVVSESGNLGNVLAEASIDCQPIIPTATVDVQGTQNAQATQIAIDAFATATAVDIQQTQIANNLNATSQANTSNTGGTATVIADQINATGTSLAATATQIANNANVPPTVTMVAPAQATVVDTVVPPTLVQNVPATATLSVTNTVAGLSRCDLGGDVLLMVDFTGGRTEPVLVEGYDPSGLQVSRTEPAVSGSDSVAVMIPFSNGGDYRIVVKQTNGQVVYDGTVSCTVAPATATLAPTIVPPTLVQSVPVTATLSVTNAVAGLSRCNLGGDVLLMVDFTGGRTEPVLVEGYSPSGLQVSRTEPAVSGSDSVAVMIPFSNGGDYRIVVKQTNGQVVYDGTVSCTVAPITVTPVNTVAPPQAAAVNVPPTVTLAAPAQATPVDTVVPPTLVANVPATITPTDVSVAATPTIDASPVGQSATETPAAQATTELPSPTPTPADSSSGGEITGRPINGEQCIGITNAPPEIVAVLDELLLQFLNPDQGRFMLDKDPAPGVVMRVESPDWIYYEAAGLANVETLEPLGCERPFEIGSNTKMMTATVILQLQEEGLLNIDDLIEQHLPDVVEALPFGDQITLRMLLNHTSGIYDYAGEIGEGGIIANGLSDRDALRQGYTPDELILYAVDNGTQYFEPGEEGQWHYSNTNYILLGMIIEKLTGQDLATVFDERIFTPLGMDDTFLWNDVPQEDFNLPDAYLSYPFDQETIEWNLSQGWAAGAVISTADDMHLFIRGLLNGALFVNDDTLAIMQETIYAEGVIANYGLGLMSQFGEGNTWGHGGQTLGFESTVIYNVTNDITIVVWTNAADDLAGIGSFVTIGALQEAGIEP